MPGPTNIRWFNANMKSAPSAETQRLHDALRNRQLAAPKLTQESPAPASITQPPTKRASALFHNLPSQSTPFIGREAEIAEIRQLLCEEEQCRLLNLIRPGGIGKTRLAIETASKVADTFADGVCFVSLVAAGAGRFFSYAR